jgi:hypothetical protein
VNWSPHIAAYAIVQPYTDKGDRLETAIVVREHLAGASAGAYIWLILLYGYFWWFVAVVPADADIQLPPPDDVR